MGSTELDAHFLIIRSKHKAFVPWYQYRCWFGQGIIFLPGIPATNIQCFFFSSSFFSILWFVYFVKIFHLLTIFSRIHNIKNNFPNFFKKIQPQCENSPREITFLYRISFVFPLQIYLLYDRPCNFSFSHQAAPNHSHWPGRTSTYTGTLTVLSKASQRLSLSYSDFV